MRKSRIVKRKNTTFRNMSHLLVNPVTSRISSLTGNFAFWEKEKLRKINMSEDILINMSEDMLIRKQKEIKRE